MPEKIRITCPICGSMPDERQLDLTLQKKPAKIVVFLQKWGGKLPAQPGLSPMEKLKKKRGSAPGYQEYIDITEALTQEQKAKYTAWFDKRIKEYQKGK